MRIIKSKFLYVIIYLLGVMAIHAKPTPPTPGFMDVPASPPGEPLPIDDGIMSLIVIAVLYGIYIIFKYHSKEKTPFM